jgi:SAM-dependent methyltransferase
MVILKLFYVMKMLVFRHKFVSRLLSFLPLGRLAFRTSVALKRLSLYFGSWSQRAVEYPWVLKQLEILKPMAIVLDVGCAESMLSHESIAKGYRVAGIDIREYPFKNDRMAFYNRNILKSGLPSEVFDGIIVVSTIEHIGLNVYDQHLFDDKGDIKAMREFYRMLKPGGIIILTTPYIGNEPLRVSPSERNYNRKRLTELVKSFDILKEEYFYPLRRGKRFIWVKFDRKQIDEKTFPEAGLACLVLQKPFYQ